jgi:hydroxypyruvate isomerase
MPKFAANLTMLFTEVDFLDRFAAAAEAGFTAVEYLFPYAFPADQLAERLGSHGLTQVLHNLPAGDWAAGERGIACHPDRVGEFQEGVGRAVEYAMALGCPRLNCLPGIVPRGVSAEAARETIVGNLRFAAAELERSGIQLLVEMINTRDVPGFYLNHTRQAVGLVAEVGVANLGIQYDVYHMQVMEGDLASTIQGNLAQIGHIQVADNPGRHEPGTGEINFPFLFDFLDRVGYEGWIGCEYVPATDTVGGLGWIESYLRP